MLLALVPGALRAQAPGDLDPGFNATVDIPINKVVLQPDGKVLIGGQFDQVNGQHRHGIARLNADGSLDPGFNPAAGDNNFAEVQSIVLQPDGKVLVAGRIYNGATAPQTQGILRLNTDGTLDPGFGFQTFNANPNGFSVGIGLQPNGKILFGLFGLPIPNDQFGSTYGQVFRFNANGTLDPGFNVTTNFDVQRIVVQPDGKILLGGGFSQINGVTHNSIARVNTDGSLDAGFNAGTDRVNDIALQPDGKIVLVGNFTNVNGVNRGADLNYVTRLNADGSTDAGFLGGVNLNTYGVALQPDGKILLAGQFGLVDGVARYRIARLNPDGSLDDSLNANPDVGLSSVAVQPDGKIIIAGAFTAVNGVTHGRIARLLGVPGGPGALQFSAANFNVTENGGRVVLAVSRTGGSVGPVSVTYTTADGTAVAGTDYTAASGTLSWADGDSADKTITVPVLDRGAYDGSSRTFSLVLNAPTGGATLGTIPVATVTVLDNDVAPQPTITITSPPTNVTVVSGSSVPLSASVSDPAGILTQVRFFLNGALYVPSSSKMGPFTVNATAPTPGTYVLQAVAIDSQSRQSNSSRTLTVAAVDAANPPPATDLVTDLNTRLLAGGTDVTLTATADSNSPDGTPLAEVDFYADNTLIASFNGEGNPLTSGTIAGSGRRTADTTGATPVKSGSIFSAVWSIPNLSKLVNLITVAKNKAGLSQVSTPVTVSTVANNATSNHPPRAALTGVAAGQRVRVGSTLTVPVTVSDPDAGNPISSGVVANGSARRRNAIGVPGSVISTVEYYLNKLKVGTAMQPPYGYQVTPPAAGTYVLEAIVTDDAGLSGVADPVTIQVGNPTVSFSIAGVAAGTRSTSIAENGPKLKILVTRSGDDLSQPLTVNYKAAGSAQAGVNYKPLTGTVVIPAGSASAKIKVRSFDDGITGDTTVLKLKMRASTDGSYDLGSPTKLKISIVDAGS